MYINKVRKITKWKTVSLFQLLAIMEVCKSMKIKIIKIFVKYNKTLLLLEKMY